MRAVGRDLVGIKEERHTIRRYAGNVGLVTVTRSGWLERVVRPSALSSLSRGTQSSGSLMQLDTFLATASVWVLPVVLAITLHEAAHGFVAHRLGDDTAYRLGRVTMSPLKHIDPVGTILMPAILLLLRTPFLFGYAKPVPVNFKALRNPRRDMVLVALAGPLTNIVIATVAAALFHLVPHLPGNAAQWVAQNLKNALIVNVVLAVFNMLPILPLDGGRVVVGLLPNVLAVPFARLEPFGMMILIALLLFLPVLGPQFGVDLNIISHLILRPTEAILRAILLVTGNG